MQNTDRIHWKTLFSTPIKKSIFHIVGILIFFMLFSFYSFASGTGTGGGGGGGGPVEPPEGIECMDNEPPGTTVCDATPICGFDGYCGRTDGNSASAWQELKDAVCAATSVGFDCLTVDNDYYLSFVADESTISFDVYVYDCLKPVSTKAIQIAVFSAENCSGGPVEVYFADMKLEQQSDAHSITVNGLTPGEEYYVMIDGFSGQDCGFTFVAEEGFSTAVNVTASSTDICLGDEVTLNATGGDDYEWEGEGLNSTTGSTVTATPSSEGSFEYGVTNAEGECGGTSSASVIINVDDCDEECTPPTLSTSPIQVCEVENVDLNDAISGASQGEITFYNSENDANNGTNSTSAFVSESGSYWVRIEDESEDDCFNVYEISVEITEEIVPTFENPGPLCIDQDFTLPGTSENGIEGTWSPAINTQETTTYTFTPEATENCATPIEMEVEMSTEVEPTFNNPGPICRGESFELPTNSKNNIEGTWSPGINTEETTTYTFTPDDEDGCAIPTTMEVVVKTPPSASISSDQEACSGDSNPQVVLTGKDGTENYEFIYTINNEENTVSSNGETATISIPTDESGTYSITITNVTDEDGNGCTSEVEETAVITIHSTPEADFDASAYEGEPGDIIDFENHSSDYEVIGWTHSFLGTENPIGNEDEFSYEFNETGEHIISLVATNEMCSDSIAKKIIIASTMEYNLPNIFTPNGDGSNDLLDFHFQNVESVELVILNRWGNIVFETNDLANSWNGKVNNSGSECEDGVYFYKFTIKDA